MRHVDLTQLPRDKRNYIAWNQAAGFQIPFIYDHLRGEMTILQANKGKHGEAILEIEFENRIIHSVPASSVKNCILGRILQTRSFDFVTVIGQQFQDERRHYQIVGQRRGVLKANPEATQREVEILCFLCGAKTWMAEERVLPPMPIFPIVRKAFHCRNRSLDDPVLSWWDCAGQTVHARSESEASFSLSLLRENKGKSDRDLNFKPHAFDRLCLLLVGWPFLSSSAD